MINILVINNDIDTMSLIKTWLEKKSYNVEYTSNADETADLVLRLKPRVVIVDELQQAVIEKIPSGIAIILMTGYSFRNLPANLRADDVIEKPFQPEKLNRLIEKHILQQQ